MKNRASWYLSTVILGFALLLSLPAAGVAADSAAAPAGGSPPRATAAPATGVTVIDKADGVIPNANHYKCYPILSASDFVERKVYLKDQFSSTWVKVLKPVYLCNPVEKITEDGTVYDPPQWDAHLVCYLIEEEFPTRDWKVQTYDQFGWLTLKGNAAELLCLPANKYVLSGPGAAGGATP